MRFNRLDRQLRLNACIQEIADESEAIDAIIAIERRFHMVGSTWTRGDVNERFGDMYENIGLPRREMSDAEWDTFRSGGLWTKYYYEYCGNMNDAIVDEFYTLDLNPKEDENGSLL